MTGTESATNGILVRTAGGTWTSPEGTGYPNEAELQAMLHAQPSLIEGTNADAVAVQEFVTDVGRADLLVLDTTGSITVVECKLGANSEARRTIVGQVLDYAARLAEMSVEEFARRWTERGGPSLDTYFHDGASEGRETFESNLSSGVFTLVLAVDTIGADLRRIVRYLNTHTTPGMRILAIELRRATHGDTEILIPTVYGNESAEQKDAKRRTGRRWSPDDVAAQLRETNSSLADAIVAFQREVTAAGFRVQGGGEGLDPSFSIWGSPNGTADITPFSVYAGTTPALGCNFVWTQPAGEQAVQAFLQDLVAAGLELRSGEIVASGFRKRPLVPLAVLEDPDRRRRIVEAAVVLLGRAG